MARHHKIIAIEHQPIEVREASTMEDIPYPYFAVEKKGATLQPKTHTPKRHAPFNGLGETHHDRPVRQFLHPFHDGNWVRDIVEEADCCARAEHALGNRIGKGADTK